MEGAGHVVVTERSGVVEDEVVGDVFDRGFGKAGLIHDGSVRHVFAPLVLFEKGEGVLFGAALTVGGDELKGFVFERFGQTDHARSEMLAAHSSTPDNEECNLSFEVGRGVYFGACPVLPPENFFGGAFDFAVVLLAGGERETEENGGEEDSEHGLGVLKS